MADQSDILLLFNLKHNPSALAGLVTFSEDGSFSAVASAAYLGASVADLLDKLLKRGAIEVVDSFTKIVCPNCYSSQFEMEATITGRESLPLAATSATADSSPAVESGRGGKFFQVFKLSTPTDRRLASAKGGRGRKSSEPRKLGSPCRERIVQVCKV